MSRVTNLPPIGQRAKKFPTAAYQKTFRDTPCESCGINDGTVVGAHFNFEGGGMGYRAPGVVAGLCQVCHNLADGRTNAPYEERIKIWLRVLAGVLRNRARIKMSPIETGKSDD